MASPIPSPQPFGIAATASVSGWSTSGINPAASSGPTSAAPGPHYVEEQSLSITYARVPVTNPYTQATLDLSSASSTYVHTNTSLACIVTAEYSRRKVNAIYQTATYQQPQKFQFLSVSSDAQGNTYGEVDASTLGPAGNIITSQPYYYRRPWNDATDSEVSKSVTVANFGIAASASDFGIRVYRQDQYLNNFPAFYIRSQFPFTFLFAEQEFARLMPLPDYYLPGPYNTGQESLASIIGFLNSLALAIRTEQMCAIPANFGSYNPPFDTVIDLFRDTGLPEYDGTRHDYS